MFFRGFYFWVYSDIRSDDKTLKVFSDNYKNLEGLILDQFFNFFLQFRNVSLKF